jgi:ketosteroid isomerase-like protein
VSTVAYPRAEIEQTFIAFRAALERAMRTGDWSVWAQFYTEDAVYVEHAMGTFRGRRAIHDWILATMALPLVRDITAFPVGWHVICEQRGWVIAQFFSRMRDPGDGSRHETYNLTVLHYAGNGQWSYEEDVYNPAHMQKMLQNWAAARDAIATRAARHGTEGNT